MLNINIDCQKLYEFPRTRQLYQQLVRYPQEIIPVMDLVVHRTFCVLFGEDSLNERRIQVAAASDPFAQLSLTCTFE